MSEQRTVAIVGSSLSGKTTLLESLLFVSGAISRKGSVKEGNTVGDGAAEARERQMSTEVSVARAEHRGVTFTFLDCPGSIEFAAEARNALIGADAALLVCEAVPERVTMLAPIFRFLNDHEIPHLAFINKIDRASVPMRDVLPAMQAVSARPLLLHQVPIRDGDAIIGYVELVSSQAYAYKEGAASEEVTAPVESSLIQTRPFAPQLRAHSVHRSSFLRDAPAPSGTTIARTLPPASRASSNTRKPLPVAASETSRISRANRRSGRSLP